MIESDLLMLIGRKEFRLLCGVPVPTVSPWAKVNLLYIPGGLDRTVLIPGVSTWAKVRSRESEGFNAMNPFDPGLHPGLY